MYANEHSVHRSDTDAELALVREEALAGGADAAVVSNHWAKGGAGAKNLAEAVIAICEGESEFKFLYDLNLSIEDKINAIGREIYGADGIELSDLARQQIETYTRQGYSDLPSKNFEFELSLILTVTASLHGEDSVLILSRSQTQERADRFVPPSCFRAII